MADRNTVSGSRVILVDDDDDVRRSLGALLKSAGYAVDVYANAEEFLAGTGSSAAARCLVADVRMPEMSGLDLLRALKKKQSSVPVVLITGHADVQMAVEAMKAGAVDFIEKPFTAEEILEAVQLASGRVAAHNFDADREDVLNRFKSLTRREKETFDLLVEGHTNKSAAQRLSISPRTVEIYRSKVMEKMGSKSLAELVRMSFATHPGPSP